MTIDLAPIQGNGWDGVKTISGEETVNLYASCWGNAGLSSGTLFVTTSVAGFAKGDLVCIIQMTGTGQGKFEFNRIKGADKGKLFMQIPLTHSYLSSGLSDSWAQVIKVPEYTSVTTISGGTLKAPAWDDRTGGIAMMVCTGRVSFEIGASIDAEGLYVSCDEILNRGNIAVGDGDQTYVGSSFFVRSRITDMGTSEPVDSWEATGSDFGFSIDGEPITGDEDEIFVQSCGTVVSGTGSSPASNKNIGGHSWCVANFIPFF